MLTPLIIAFIFALLLTIGLSYYFINELKVKHEQDTEDLKEVAVLLQRFNRASMEYLSYYPLNMNKAEIYFKMLKSIQLELNKYGITNPLNYVYAIRNRLYYSGAPETKEEASI